MAAAGTGIGALGSAAGGLGTALGAGAGALPSALGLQGVGTARGGLGTSLGATAAAPLEALAGGLGSVGTAPGPQAAPAVAADIPAAVTAGQTGVVGAGTPHAAGQTLATGPVAPPTAAPAVAADIPAQTVAKGSAMPVAPDVPAGFMGGLFEQALPKVGQAIGAQFLNDLLFAQPPTATGGSATTVVEPSKRTRSLGRGAAERRVREGRRGSPRRRREDEEA